MRHPTLSFLLLPSFLLATPGCLHEPALEGELEPEPASAAPPPGQNGENRETTEVDIASEGAGELGLARTEPTPPASERLRRDPRFFSLGAGYGVLGRIDLGSCRDDGLSPGYWHMRVTFERSGRVVHASIQSPTAPKPEALGCISQELATFTMPRFDGDNVTLSKNFFVGPESAPAPGNIEEIEVKTAPAMPPATAANPGALAL